MAEPLKVAMLTTSYPRWDGDFAGHFVASLAEELSSAGHAVTVLAPHEAGTASVERVRGVSVRRFRYAPEALEHLAYGDGIASNLRRRPMVALAAPGLALGMRRALRAHACDADVVHVHWAPTAALSSPRGLGVPVVLTLHGSDATLAGRGRVWRTLFRRGIGQADGVCAVARTHVSLVREAGFLGPLEVIPSGVPRGLSLRARQARRDPATILYVGRLVEAKGVGDLLEAFISSADRLGDARLVFVGDGPMREVLRVRAVGSSAASRIRFEGTLPHDAALDSMSAADLVVLPSYAEGSPLCLTEALALGTPVLATEVGGVPDLVGEAGRVVAPGDVAGLSAALVDLLEDRQRLSSLGAGVRKRIADTLSWPVVASRTEQLYRETIEACAGRHS